MLGDNIKVHFAGTEQTQFGLCAAEAGVKYYLFTVFPFICRDFGIKGYPLTCKNLFPPDELAKISKHTIMDSGLFTLMFGAHAGKRDEAFLTGWQEALCGFVNTYNIQATCVEIDCQKILGVEQAWKFRERMPSMIPNNRIINVFHFEDGQKGLDRLIEFSNYIAISVPELRIAKRKTYKHDVYKLASYIKNKKPEIDIHLLGCTELEMLRQCNFCTSSDSTAWQSVNRFGSLFGRHISTLKENAIPNVQEKARRILAKCNIEETPTRIAYHSNFIKAAYIHRMQYTKYAGNQD